MKVILRNDYEGLGKSGQVINVADGYARNFLIPRNIALSYTASNQRILEEDKKVLEVRKNINLLLSWLSTYVIAGDITEAVLPIPVGA